MRNEKHPISHGILSCVFAHLIKALCTDNDMYYLPQKKPKQVLIGVQARTPLYDIQFNT